MVQKISSSQKVKFVLLKSGTFLSNYILVMYYGTNHFWDDTMNISQFQVSLFNMT